MNNFNIKLLFEEGQISVTIHDEPFHPDKSTLISNTQEIDTCLELNDTKIRERINGAFHSILDHYFRIKNGLY